MTSTSDDSADIAAIVAIQQLVARYNHAVDSGDAATWVACFAPDGVFVDDRRTLRGHDELLAFAPTVQQRRPGARHTTTDLLVDVDGDRARLRAYLRFAGRGDGGPGPLTPYSTGVYDDVVVRIGGRWLFAQRNLSYD